MALDIKRGPTVEPLRILLHGQEGVGKTTWAAACPRALFLTCEDGGGDLDYERAVLGSWRELREAVIAIGRDPGEYETVVIDTIDSFERLLWVAICERAEVDSIEQVGGGYGKGYTAAAEEMAGLAADLDTLRHRRRVNVILLAHSHVRPFNDPMGAPYDRYEVRLHKGTAALWSGWADAILFACFDVTVMKQGKKGRAVEAGAMEKGKAIDGAKRVIYTSKEAAYDAKNRHKLPEELPLDWRAFASAIRWDDRVRAIRGAGKVTHAPDGDGHHPSWTDGERGWFMAQLNGLGVTYPDIKAFCLALNRQKPSATDSETRRKLLAYIGDAGKAKLENFIHTGTLEAK
jgi:hypothetical protein